jgi:hypothetical protein
MNYEVSIYPIDKDTPYLLSQEEVRDTLKSSTLKIGGNIIFHQGVKLNVIVKSEKHNGTGLNKFKIQWWNGDTNTGLVN